MEFGDQILVQFTLPELTTDGIVQQRVRGVELYAGPAGQPFDRGQWMASARRVPVDVTAPGPMEKEFPVAPEWFGRQIVIAGRIIGETGRASDWGGNEILAVELPLTAPTAFQAAPSPSGVALRWTGSGPRYRVLRSLPDAPGEPERALVPIGETDTATYVDANAVYGMHYRYMVVAMADEKHQSLPSEAVSITPMDVFAPAVPTGVMARPGPQSVDLTWTRNMEDDFQGYNVRRSAGTGPFELIARLLVAPAYEDRAVESGKQYRYTVTAVDMLGNESALSAPITAVVP